MKKSILSVITGILILGSTLPALAQTQSAQDLIKQLQAQIETLKTQIEALQKAKSQVAGTQQDIKGTLKLLRKLNEGMSGDDVKLLQTILAADPEIYPEGRITGFYGALTSRAVRKFQRKHKFEQVGNVGPRTLKRLNEELDNNPVATQTSQTGEKEHCAIVPPGHLIAPGWLRKHGGVKPIVPECQTLPPGIANKLATTTPVVPPAVPPPPTDSTPPTISAISATGITANSATIYWTTNEQTKGRVYYSKSVLNLASTSATFVAEDTFLAIHSISLTGLASSTVYYYLIAAADASENTATSSQNTFTTALPTATDSTPPVISSVSTSALTMTGATVAWTTDESSNSRVYYGTSSPLDLSTASSIFNSTLVTAHSVEVVGLSAGTNYYYVVESADSSLNKATSSEQSFATAAPDTTPPVISAVTSTTVTAGSATIAWTTNEVAATKVYYSAVSPINLLASNFVINGTLVTGHSINISALSASTTYYFVVESTDGSGNTATSSQYLFTTLPPPDTTMPVLSSIASSGITSTGATITWNTNEAATSKVYYGTTTPLVLSSAASISDSSLLTGHSLGITGLTASTTYYFVAESKDAANNTGTSAEQSFTALP